MKERVAVAIVRHAGPPGLRVGIDVVRRGRLRASIDRLGDRFARTIFHPRELATIDQDGDQAECRFAAKEALVKAIGTGVVSGVELPDIETTGDAVVLHGGLRLVLARLGWRAWSAPLAGGERCVGAVVWLG